MTKQVQESKKKDKRILTLFFLIVPSLLIAMASAIDDRLIMLCFQVVLIFFQIVIFKNLLDDYYGEADEN